MFRLISQFCLSLAVVSAVPAAAVAAKPLPPPPGGVVLLANGRVMTGRVERHGNYVEIVSPGAAIRIRKSEVLLEASSLLDAYRQQRRRITEPTANRHLELATWCLQQQLWPQAENELRDASQLDPPHPRLELLQRRLAVARKIPKTAVALPTNQPDTADQPALTAEQEILQRKDFPDGTIELFTRRVQPLLVNNCTSVGCHREGGTSEFQLSRALLHGESNRNTTGQNLAATLAQVNCRCPDDSPLLTIPLRAHGGTEGSIFPPHRRKLYEQLAAWVRLASGEGNPLSARPEEPHLATPIPEILAPAAPQRGVAPAGYSQSRSPRTGPPRIRFGAQYPGGRPRSLSAQRISEEIADAAAATPAPTEPPVAVEPDSQPESAAQSDSPPDSTSEPQSE